ncbi:leucine-rich repeat protein (LRRP), putative [Trypanosoma equiperdum]|uniref:Leucine-rich repeat protein (LRRP), putative n=1 Tax=Trypanosoma equiperdum TaxID=5694 RepID=A0A1G4IET3_TRYEQ|nr:leucine-rich repeat protein (LRRP), putative [Trypanosoma equiperdum]
MGITLANKKHKSEPSEQSAVQIQHHLEAGTCQLLTAESKTDEDPAMAMGALMEEKKRLEEEAYLIKSSVETHKNELSKLTGGEQSKKHMVLASIDYTHYDGPQNASEATLSTVDIDRGQFLAARGATALRKLHVTVGSSAFDVKSLCEWKFIEELCVSIRNGTVANVHYAVQLPKLKKLWLKGECVDNNDSRHISHMAALEELTISNCAKLTSVEGIHRLQNLTMLDLSRTCVDNSFMVELSMCPSLLVLDLSFCYRITNAIPLSKIETLEELCLEDCRGIEKGIGTFGSLPRLRVLNIKGLRLTNACIGGLSGSKSIIRLKMENFVESRGSRKLLNIKTLRKLCVHSSNHTDCEISGYLKNCRKSFVSGAEGLLIDDRSLKTICASRFLVSLDVSHSLALTNVSPICMALNLEELNLKGCCNIQNGLDKLGSLSKLSVLLLSETTTKGEGISTVSNCKRLDTLKLYMDKQYYLNTKRWDRIKFPALEPDNRCGTARKDGIIGTLLNLRVLKLKNICLGGGYVSALAASDSLVSLTLKNCTGIGDVTPLSSIWTLEKLSLYGCSSVDVGFGSLGRLPRLRALNIGKTCANNYSLTNICSSTTLVQLDISCCEAITDIKPLTKVKTLEEVSLASCRNIRSGLYNLNNIPCLRVAILYSTVITNEEVRALKRCGSLSVLDLGRCDAFSDITSIEGFTNLEVLDLFAYRGGSICMAALCKLRWLRVLDLTCVRVSDDHLKKLCSGAKLEELRLCSCNEITNIEPVAKMKPLKILHLDQCKNIKRGFDSLLELPYLHLLSLPDSRISSRIMEALKAKHISMGPWKIHLGLKQYSVPCSQC